jgi:hypothetical protein
LKTFQELKSDESISFGRIPLYAINPNLVKQDHAKIWYFKKKKKDNEYSIAIEELKRLKGLEK